MDEGKFEARKKREGRRKEKGREEKGKRKGGERKREGRRKEKGREEKGKGKGGSVWEAFLPFELHHTYPLSKKHLPILIKLESHTICM